MSRVALAQIPSLTFYQDAETASRRGNPIPQLTCIGQACRLYTPEVVRCTSIGGSGTDVDWKCEADLPEALRFGRVEVSCEGWSGPGDPYVLKGSCGLEYRLVHLPDSLRKDNDHRLPSRWYRAIFADPTATFFYMLWIGFLFLMLYKMLKSCFGDEARGGPSPGSSSGSWGSGSRGNHRHDPPPPYSKYNQTEQRPQGWEPGFWTGVGLGGLGGYLFNNGSRRRDAYDWERERILRTTRPVYQSEPLFSSGRRQTHFGQSDRGEGSSNLGPMRRGTGLGGSNVR